LLDAPHEEENASGPDRGSQVPNVSWVAELVFRVEFEGCEAQILANLPRVPVKAFGDTLIAAQARDFRDPVESCGNSSVVR